VQVLSFIGSWVFLWRGTENGDFLQALLQPPTHCTALPFINTWLYPAKKTARDKENQAIGNQKSSLFISTEESALQTCFEFT
jgi:hypothetical protein